MGKSQTGSVRRRRVFYIPGYDPFPARRYRELYRRESARQADISGYRIAVKAAERGHGWHAAANMEGAQVLSRIDVLEWSDLVQESMGQSIPATYAQMLRTAWTYIGTGTFRRLMWMRKGPVLAALYPIAMLTLQALVALLLALWIGGMAAGLHWALGLPVGALVFAAALRLARKADRWLFAYYLMHDFAFTAKEKGAYPAALEERIAAFAERISVALAEDVDEVLVVGHSSGAHLAVSVVADLVRRHGVPANGPELALLTLGQVIPMVSFLPRADRLRADLRFLSTRDEIAWIDVSAPGDGASFALCDPVAVTGVAPETGKRWPLVLSAAYTLTLSEETQAALRWRFFRLHFQYLCAFDKPRGYDYFAITAGPRTLRARFAERAPSRSRIDVAASKYTSMAA